MFQKPFCSIVEAVLHLPPGTFWLVIVWRSYQVEHKSANKSFCASERAEFSELLRSKFRLEADDKDVRDLARTLKHKPFAMTQAAAYLL